MTKTVMLVNLDIELHIAKSIFAYSAIELLVNFLNSAERGIIR